MSEIKITEYSRLKMAHRANSVDEQVLKDTLDDDIFFKGVPEYVPDTGDTIVDVGAHIGAFSLLAAARTPGGKIFAIEPSNESYNLLVENIRLNGYDNIKAFKIGLNEMAGEVKLFHDIETGNWGHSIVKEFSAKGEIIKCDTLTNFLNVNGITKCDFIKFNCEGAEFKILLTTPEKVLRKIGAILVLYHCDLETNFHLEQLTSHLRKAGFLVVYRFQFGERGWIVGHRDVMKYYFYKLKHWIKEIIKKN